MAGDVRTSLEEQAEKILESAKAAGVEESFYFATTFARYQRQLKMLADLEVVLDEGEALVEKEYVKGRKNLYANPAIAQYNSTADAANRTVATLLKIVATFRPEPEPAGDALKGFIERR